MMRCGPKTAAAVFAFELSFVLQKEETECSHHEETFVFQRKLVDYVASTVREFCCFAWKILSIIFMDRI